MSRYAANTQVSTDKSQAEIKRVLQRYGAGQYAPAEDWENGLAIICFSYQRRAVKIVLELPKRDDQEFVLTGTGKTRKPAAAIKAWEQACRQRWRALALVVKAKLEAVEAGIATFEQEFMPYLVLPGGQTVGERLLPQITKGIEAGRMPKALPLFEDQS